MRKIKLLSLLATTLTFLGKPQKLLAENKDEVRDNHGPQGSDSLEVFIPHQSISGDVKLVNEGEKDAFNGGELSSKRETDKETGGCRNRETDKEEGLASDLLQLVGGSKEDTPAASAQSHESAEAASRRLAAEIDVTEEKRDKKPHASRAVALPPPAPSPDSSAFRDSCVLLDQRFEGGEVVEAASPHACRTKCLDREGCTHLNFLFSSKTCELVFAKIKPPKKEDFKDAIAASVECQLPHNTLFYTNNKSDISNAAPAQLGVSEDLLSPQDQKVAKETNPFDVDVGENKEELLQIRNNNEDSLHQRSQVCSDKYVLADTFRGSDFWDPAKFFFFEWGDPTGGTVEYVNKSVAQQYRLINNTSDGRAQIYADTTETLGAGRGRKAVRITSQKAWRDAMFVMDLNHMPTGCGTWPAWWTVGWDPWPDTGEIDIIEGANLQDHAHSALHTKKGCIMPSSTSKFNGYWSRTSSGTALNCWNLATPDNTGCSIESYEDAYGAPLNRKGGGYYVMQLHHDKYIRVWFFTRQEAPTDLKSGNPTPDFWTKTPIAYFTLGSSCPGSYFGEQRIVLNTTFCGGYSGYNFTTANGCPGNGLADCENYVRKNPSAFKEAYWDIGFMKVYRRSGQTCQTVAATTTTTTTKKTTTTTRTTAKTTTTTTRKTQTQPSWDWDWDWDWDDEGNNDDDYIYDDDDVTVITTTTTRATTTTSRGGWWPWPSPAVSPTPSKAALVLLAFIYGLL